MKRPFQFGVGNPPPLPTVVAGATIEYLKRIPADDGEIPAGQVVVHNHVVPTERLGSRGFRAWTQEPTDRLIECDCDWARKKISTHYRVDQ